MKLIDGFIFTYFSKFGLCYSVCGSGIVFHVKSWSGYELCYLLTPLLTCVSTVVSMLAWQCLLGAGSLGVWFSALHEVPYFIMMELLFLLPCDFFFEVKF